MKIRTNWGIKYANYRKIIWVSLKTVPRQGRGRQFDMHVSDCTQPTLSLTTLPIYLSIEGRRTMILWDIQSIFALDLVQHSTWDATNSVCGSFTVCRLCESSIYIGKSVIGHAQGYFLRILFNQGWIFDYYCSLFMHVVLCCPHNTALNTGKRLMEAEMERFRG